MSVDIEALAAALAPSGLSLRGGFALDGMDEPPPGIDGGPGRTLVLVGNIGAAHWPAFNAWRETQAELPADPLDTWTRVVVDPIAGAFAARAIYPFETPYHPFQRWAMQAEGLKPSPLGILIHPRHGLWHAYRAALVFADEVTIQAPAATSHACDLCAGKPCLKSCPVGAHSESGFAYKSCLDHVWSPAGEPCRDAGCLDRNACPVGADLRYPADMQAFHMAAFSRSGKAAFSGRSR